MELWRKEIDGSVSLLAQSELPPEMCQKLPPISEQVEGIEPDINILQMSDPDFSIEFAWTRCTGDDSVLKRSLFTKVQLSGLGLSLIDSHPKELMYISLQGIDLEYSDSAETTMVLLNMKWFQIDNQVSFIL